MNIIDVSAKYPDYAVERMRDLLRAVMADTKRDAGKILRETAVSFARSAWERTPKGKTLVNAKVDSKSLPKHHGKGPYVWTWMRMADGNFARLPMPLDIAKFSGFTRSGGKRPQFHRAEYQGTKQVVRNRGFARSGWLGVLHKLNVMQSADEDGTPDAETGKTVFNAARENADLQFVEISQHTPPAIWQNTQRDIMARSLAVTNQNLQRQLETHSRQIKQRWEK